MVTGGRLKSRSFRRVKRVTPSGRNVIHYKRRKPAKATCGNCGKPLSGVPRTFQRKMQNMPKTAKRPERPFGGVLCSKCSRDEIKAKVRSQ